MERQQPQLGVLLFCLLKIGAAAVLVNTCYKENELEGILRDNDIEYLFHGYGCKSTVYEDLLKKIPVETLPYLKKNCSSGGGTGE